MVKKNHGENFFHLFFTLLLNQFLSQNMSYQDAKAYITHLPTCQVVICRFCEACIPPKDPLWHYKENHTAKKDHHVPMEIRLKIAEVMVTLDLRQPQEVGTPDD